MATPFKEHADPKLAEVVRRLVERLQPDCIYLFGSQVRGDAEEGSDYDIMVVVAESDEPGHKRIREAHRALGQVDLPVQIIVVTWAEFEQDLPVPASLPATVGREGKLLYAA